MTNTSEEDPSALATPTSASKRTRQYSSAEGTNACRVCGERRRRSDRDMLRVGSLYTRLG